MEKKKQEAPKWILPVIVVGFALIFLVFSGGIELGTNTKENSVYNKQTYTENIDVRETNTETYCLNGDCYTTKTEYNQALENYQNNQAYEEVDNLWTQHRGILKNDAEKITEINDNYCKNIDMTGIPNCINFAYPRLEAYANHIVNAQNFMQNNGGVFSNQQELFGYLDEHAVYVKSSANILDSMINQYNTWIQQQQNQQAQAQQEAEALSNILKILALAI